MDPPLEMLSLYCPLALPLSKIMFLRVTLAAVMLNILENPLASIICPAPSIVKFAGMFVRFMHPSSGSSTPSVVKR